MKYAVALAYGVTSKACVRQTPAIGHAVTLRTVLPHASRVVIPTAAKPPHNRWRVFDMDVVELEILARRDVSDGIRVLFGEFGQHFQLMRVQSAERNFDALHAGRVPQRSWSLRVRRGVFELAGLLAVVSLAIVVPLAVCASA